MRLRIKIAAGLAAVAAAVGFPSAAAAALPPACNAVSFTQIGEPSSGPSLSPDGTKIAYHAQDSLGQFQLFTSNVDGTNRTRISDGGGVNEPDINSHKTNAAWHPSGDFIFLAVERRPNPMDFFETRRWALPGQYLAENGTYQELWATTPDGFRWWKLRDIIDPNTREGGTMHIQISPDGSKIAWADLYQAAREPDYPWAGYNLLVGDIVINNGVPSVVNVQNRTPDGAKLIEPGAWVDNNTLIVGTDIGSTGDTHLGSGDLDVFSVNVNTREATNLTRDEDWDEHPRLTPDGQKITYLNVSEIFMMERDGSNAPGEILTHFNDWAYPAWNQAAREWPIIPTTGVWTPDGRHYAVTLQSVWRYPVAWIVVVNFAGNCGGTAATGTTSAAKVAALTDVQRPELPAPPASKKQAKKLR